MNKILLTISLLGISITQANADSRHLIGALVTGYSPPEISGVKKILYLAKKNPSTSKTTIPPVGEFTVYCIQGVDANNPLNAGKVKEAELDSNDPFESKSYLFLEKWRRGTVQAKFDNIPVDVGDKGTISSDSRYTIFPEDPTGYYPTKEMAYSPERKSWHYSLNFPLRLRDGKIQQVKRECDMRFGKTDGGEDFIVMRTSEIQTTGTTQARQEDYCIFNRR